MRYVPKVVKQYPVGFAVAGMARARRALAASMLADIGLYPGQEILLMQLDHKQGQSQKSLSDFLRIDQSTVAKSVSRLEKAGLVTRRKAEHDERISLITLTGLGEELRRRVIEIWTELETATVSVLAPGEQHDLVLLAEKLALSLEARTQASATRKRNTGR